MLSFNLALFDPPQGRVLCDGRLTWIPNGWGVRYGGRALLFCTTRGGTFQAFPFHHPQYRPDRQGD